ncbi:MAG: hypothetical protein KBF88_01925 [Polyangiaceae bacterium]|nr:hypothetical protein [Polyangiaceae bacterium]
MSAGRKKDLGFEEEADTRPANLESDTRPTNITDLGAHSVVTKPPSHAPEPTDRPTVVPKFDVSKFAKSGNSLPPESVPPVSAPPPREEEYLKAIGSLSKVPVVRVNPSELRTLPIEPAAAFLLSNMDGISTVEMLLDLGAMPRLEALRLLCSLVREHIVELC